MISRTILRTSSIAVVDHRCDAGPWAKPYAEQHEGFSIAYVRAGSFGYTREGRRCDLVPGSILIGAPGAEYVCSHEHTCGDECLSFQFTADVAHSLDGGMAMWRTCALPPLPTLLVLGELAQAAADALTDIAVDEAGLLLAGRIAGIASGRSDPVQAVAPQHRKRAIEAASWIEANAREPIDLAALADQAGLSRFHFLRLFDRVLGVTPHQHLIRTRVRHAARLLAREDIPITDAAYEAGFGDLSNFVRTFKRAAGVSPGAFRRMVRGDRNFRQAQAKGVGIA